MEKKESINAGKFILKHESEDFQQRLKRIRSLNLNKNN